MLKLKISQKLLLFFLLVSLVPLFVVIVLLVNSARTQLREAAIDRQKLIAEKTASSVDEYLKAKVDAMIFQSQTSAILNDKSEEATQNLENFTKQDSDVERVALLSRTGQEVIALNADGKSEQLQDASTTDAYRAATFLSGKEYIGPVTYGENNEPKITISVPVISFDTRQNLTELSTDEYGKYRTIDNIEGVLVATYNVSNLWQSVLSTKTEKNGYAYVVDDQGNLVAHPDKDFFAQNQNISNVSAVKDAIDGKEETDESLSEKGESVIATDKMLSKTKWAVVVQEPVASVFAGINTFINRSIIIFIGAVLLSIGMSIIFGKQISDPIKRLSVGARRMAKGDFSHGIEIRSNDELGQLAQVFNTMGASIKTLVQNLSTNNFRLMIEQAKLNSILRSVSDGVMALNRQGEIISINPPAAKLVGKQTDDLIGKKLVDTYGWLHKGKQFMPELSKPGIYHFGDMLLYKGDEVFYLDLVISVMERENNDVAAIITIHDLTPGRELDVMKLDFVAIAAHELRTPLTVVRGYLNLINTSAIRQLTIYNVENLQKAIIGTDQLNNLINNLLDISRIERGEMEIVITKLDLARLVDEIVKQHQVTAVQKNQKIEYHGAAKKVYVPGDISSLSEVVNNLLGNALKFTKDGGTVKVNMFTNNDEVRVEVVDNGPGIPKTLQSRLFTKFYRVERSLVSGNRGTGLGLYISKTIINLHKGNIGVESQEGKGSTFYFTLPIYDEAKHASLVSKEKEAIGVHGWIKKRPRR